jgi:23S rRNA (guanosine2251-2'-O)-methyltransferase
LASILKDVAETEDYTKAINPIIMLDGLSDPQNIGAILRTCAAFGVEHLIMQDKGSPDITGAMAKAAAGAVEKVRIHKVTNLSRTLEILKDNHFMVYGADGHSDNSITDVKFSPKSVIVMGAEGDGMRRLIKQNCDFIVKIPIHSEVESLNVSNAFAIILYAATLSISGSISGNSIK